MHMGWQEKCECMYWQTGPEQVHGNELVWVKTPIFVLFEDRDTLQQYGFFQYKQFMEET